MLETICKHTDENSRIILSDMNYVSENNFFVNFMLSHERGNNLRGKDDYLKFFTKYFNVQKITILNDAYRIPYSKIIFELVKK